MKAVELCPECESILELAKNPLGALGRAYEIGRLSAVKDMEDSKRRKKTEDGSYVS